MTFFSLAYCQLRTLFFQQLALSSAYKTDNVDAQLYLQSHLSKLHH